VSGSDGARELDAVRETLHRYRTDPDSATDDDLRRLRVRARHAIDSLDDEPEFDLAHETLDEVGRYVRTTRPELCIFTEDGTDFVRDCPVDLGHIRLGMSVGVEVEESVCSVCGKDPWTCAHVPGQTYDGMRMTPVITKANFFEVSVVSRPDFSGARFMSQGLPRAVVEATLGRQLLPNDRPICTRCTSPCPGLIDSPRAIHG
jgi:hypothetical protein